MAKGNPLLGFARGSIGDITFWRQDGEQHSRARNRNPKNPQTPLQLLQRVCLKTCSQAYSLMQEICDHSFQGLQEGTPNQSRFIMANVADLRTKLADEINSGDAQVITSSSKTNYASKETSLPVINDYIISEGSLPSLPLEEFVGSAMVSIVFASPLASAPTYADIISALNVQRGDQLTVLTLTTDDTIAGEQSRGMFNGFSFARIILEPAGGDLTVPFVSSYQVNDPNPKNEGSVNVVMTQEDGSYTKISFNALPGSPTPRKTNSIVANSVILSRLAGKVWQRSTQRLVLVTPSVGGLLQWAVRPLGDAVLSYMTGSDSSLYLNQAENF